MAHTRLTSDNFTGAGNLETFSGASMRLFLWHSMSLSFAGTATEHYLEVKGAKIMTICPVSYTHLDVYKRQRLDTQ